MSSNSLSMTNTKDATFNNLSLVTSNDVKNVYDIFALKGEVPDLSGIESQINAKANKTGDTFTGTITAPAISLNGVDLAGTLQGKANRTNPDFSGVVTAPGVILNNLSSSFSNPVSFSGGVSGITKAMLGLGNVDNTSDASKVLNQSQITNLLQDLRNKAPTATPTFTGDVNINKSGDNSFYVRSTSADTGSSSVWLQTTMTAGVNNERFWYTSSGLLQLRQNNVATNFTGVAGFEVYPNGVFTTGFKQQNKLLVLQESGNQSDDPVTSTN